MSTKRIVVLLFALAIVGLLAFALLQADTQTREPMPTSTPSPTNTINETDDIESQIKAALVAKHGQNAQNLDVRTNKIDGNYANGGASEIGMGGGMWFAAKVAGLWQLVWDGNGIITCTDIADYPDFPIDMIPECYNTTTNQMVVR